MKLDDILKDLLRELKEDLEDAKPEKSAKITVGQVSEDLRQDFIEFWKLEEEQKDALELRIEQLERQLKRQIIEEFEGKEEEAQRVKRAIWSKVYSQLNLDPEGQYSVNRKTGVVTQKLTPGEQF